MKKIQKLLSYVCIAALLLCAVPDALAATSPTMYFSNVTLTSGGYEGYCFLEIKDARDISAMDYMIVYDADKFELTNVYNVGFTARDDVQVSVNSSQPGIIHVTLVSYDGISGSDYLNLIYFKAKADARAGTYHTSVLVNDVYDSGLQTVEVSARNGTITVNEAVQSVGSVSFYGNISSTSLTVGESAELGINVSGDWKNLCSGSFEYTYDETKLALEEVTLSGDIEASIHDVNRGTEGLVKVAFVSGTPITSRLNLIKLRFRALAPGEATIGFSADSLYDTSFASLQSNSFIRTVLVTAPEAVVDYPDLRFALPDEIWSDKEFDVQVVLEGGSGVRAGDFAVTYDNTVLRCLGVTTQKVSGAWIVADKNFSGGSVRFSLVSNNDLTQDAALVSLNFELIENTSTQTELSLSGTGVYDVGFEPVVLEYVDANLRILHSEYTVKFYDIDGETLLSAQKVLSGGDAVAPQMPEYRTLNDSKHLHFAGWDGDFTSVTDNISVTAKYEQQSHTQVYIHEKEPTCTDDGCTDGSVCVVCGHIFDASETISALGHEESVIFVEPGCTTDGLVGGTYCIRCNEILVEPQVVPATGHTATEVSGYDATCTEQGLTDGVVCESCGYAICPQEVILPKGHNGVKIDGYDATCTEYGLTDSVICGTCGEYLVTSEPIVPLGHREVSINVSPTCTEDGLSGGVYCNRCGVILTEAQTIPALGHIERVVYGYDATCTEPGLTDGVVCDTCSEVLSKQETIPAHGHNERVIPGYKATCTEYGLTDSVICLTCGKSLVTSEPIAPTGHNGKVVYGYDATCTESGLTDGVVCDNCSEVLTKQETIPAHGHNGKAVYGYDATCTESGLTDGVVCDTCSEVLTKQETIPATGHNERVIPGYKATCTDYGLTDGVVCDTCSEVLAYQESISPIGHAERIVPGYDATCTEPGRTYGIYCDNCGDTLVSPRQIPATGHCETVMEGRAPTCFEEGLTDGLWCCVCWEILTPREPIPTLPHEEMYIYTEATCTEEGLVGGVYCLECGKILTEPTVIPPKGHTEEPMRDVEPGCDTPGYIGGTYCSECGITITEPQIVPPLGPQITVTCNAVGILRVSGKLSDTDDFEGNTFLVVYDESGKMIRMRDISGYMHTSFGLSLGKLYGAHRVKIFRWEYDSIKPCYKVAEAYVER